jgi:hypothetical protein
VAGCIPPYRHTRFASIDAAPDEAPKGRKDTLGNHLAEPRAILRIDEAIGFSFCFFDICTARAAAPTAQRERAQLPLYSLLASILDDRIFR